MSSGTGGAAGLVSACVAGLGASALQLPRKIDKVSKPSENFRGILHLWAAPTPRPSFRKDGPMTVSLAREQPLCEVLSIRSLPRSTPDARHSYGLYVLLQRAGQFRHPGTSRPGRNTS